MRVFKKWRLGQGPSVELLRYAPEQEPCTDDIEHFIVGAKVRARLLPLQTSRYVLRETRQTLSWLKSYVRSEVEDMRLSFVREDKSFYIALLEHVDTGDRSMSVRLTTAGLDGHTEWHVSVRRVHFDQSDEHFLCAKY